MILQDDEAIGQSKIRGRRKSAGLLGRRNHIENYEDMRALGKPTQRRLGTSPSSDQRRGPYCQRVVLILIKGILLIITRLLWS